MRKIFIIFILALFISFFNRMVYGQKTGEKISNGYGEFVLQVWYKTTSEIPHSYGGWRVVVNGVAVGQLPCEVVVEVGDAIKLGSFSYYKITNRIQKIVFVDDVNNSVQIDDQPEMPYYTSLTSQSDYDFFMKTPEEKLADIQGLVLDLGYAKEFASVLKRLPFLKDSQVEIFFENQIHLKDLNKVYDSCPDITSLKVMNGHYFERDISPITKFKNLKSLNLSIFQTLTDISPLEKLTELKTLKLQDLLRLKDLTPLSKLSNLRSLKLANCRKLYDISPLANLKNLEKLMIWYCTDLQDFSPLSNLTALKSLIILQAVDNLTFLKNLANLQKLNISVKGIDDISLLANLHNLRYLSLNGDSKIKKLLSLDNLPNLVSLDLSNFPEIDELSGLENEHNLLRVNLTSLPKLTTLEALGNLKSLRILKISYCGGITSFEPLKNLTNLTSLELSKSNIADLSPLRSLKKLKILKLINCNKITDISPLNDLPNLEYLVIVNCDNIKTDDVEKLQKLNPSLNLNP